MTWPSRRRTASPYDAGRATKGHPVTLGDLDDDALLDALQRAAFDWMLENANPDNGLVADNSDDGAPASIAVVGFALTCWPVGVARGWMDRNRALALTLATLRFFTHAEQGGDETGTGHRGFFYHFLDMERGRRVWNCELSLIDTALLLAGCEAASCYFDADTPDEAEVRALARALIASVEWPWALDRGDTLSQGWHPETGFIRYDWEGYSEALILYVLALGSDTHPVPPDSYRAWRVTYQWEKIYGHDTLYAGPLFIHLFSHIWLDFRTIGDGFNREKGITYFTNTRRAVQIQSDYARLNPRGFAGYDANCWGLTACDGPGGAMNTADDTGRQFLEYTARGAPFGPDDGTLAGWAPAAAMPFAPTTAMAALRTMLHRYPGMLRDDRFLGSFNPSLPGEGPEGWISPRIYGLDQGLLVLMIENHRSGMIWDLMRASQVCNTGLRRAGFKGGWLDE
ncbi:glucoamylase family protein [Oceaniglobus indicus]|uniref:glucoamylase family protein n=1 Tax=Oceaniglobus indicus TaxID=2047749 RepID=UPI000C17B570|nr:glucoamylase family protein [Oceaniglobus indicus]